MLNSPESLHLVWGPERLFFYNDAYRPILGPRLHNALGKTIMDLWPDVWHQVQPLLDDAFQGITCRYENMPVSLVRHGQQELTWWTFSYSPVYNLSEQQVLGVLCHTVETTQNVLIDKAREASEQRYRQLFEELRESQEFNSRVLASSSDCIKVIDLDGKLAFMSEGGMGVMEISDFNDVRGCPWPDFWKGQGNAQAIASIEAAKAGRNARFQGSADTYLGTPKWWDVQVTPIRDAQGAVEKILCISRDISALRDAQEELRQLNLGLEQRVEERTQASREAAQALRKTEDALRQSQKLEAIGQLTGGVAHDFNNLLTVIRSSVDLLKRNLEESRRKRYIDAISDTVDRASKLTGQLLAFARQQALRPQVFEVGQSVRGISEMISTLIGARIEVRMQLPEQPCHINADAGQFDTAIVNMAVNARDAMGGEGTLTISVQTVAQLPALRSHAAKPGEYVAVSIQDSGAGIDLTQLERIFEPFFTTKQVGKGTGLGLSQVFGFAKQSGGEVTVDSQPGAGATFTLYLPKAQGQAEAAPAINSGPATSFIHAQGASILVVEDNLEVGEFSNQSLCELGYVTHWVKNADEALLALQDPAQRFDGVFSDVVMPGMNGVDLALEIRRRYPGLPVVLTSGYSAALTQSEAHDLIFLQKPYSVDALAQILLEAMGSTAS